jgi:hypothetical protein
LATVNKLLKKMLLATQKTKAQKASLVMAGNPVKLDQS